MRRVKRIQQFVLLLVLIASSSCIVIKNFPNKVQNDKLQGFFLKNITIDFSEEFSSIKNEELGINFIKNMYEKFKYTSVIEDVNKTLIKMANKLESKLNESIAILNSTRDRIAAYVTSQGPFIQSAISHCNIDDYNLEQLDIPNIIAAKNTYSEHPVIIKQVLKTNMAKTKILKGSIKYHYFLSTADVSGTNDIEMAQCMNTDQSLIWNNYVSRMHGKKNIVLLLDHGGSLSRQQFKIVKALAKQMINVLNEEDTIKVIAISDTWSSPYLTEHCVMPNQASPKGELYNITQATTHNKELINMFIDSLAKGNGATNHSLGFQEALQAIKTSNISGDESIMLLYISRGLLSSLTEPKTVLETIGSALREINSTVIINTCAVIDESKPVMYETHFLHDLAEQNYTKYNLEPFDMATRGIMLQVNTSETIGIAVPRFYATLSSSYKYYSNINISIPKWDSVSNDLSILLTTSCGKVGLLGIGLYFSNIVEDVTYYSNYLHYTYAFIVDSQGIAVMHPSYPRPMAVTGQINFVDIRHLEKVSNFENIRQGLLNKKTGSMNIEHNGKTIKYIWKNVMGWYTICIVINEEQHQERPYKVSGFPSVTRNKLVHHRFDILHSPPALCQHFKQLATLDAGSLYLSASCFQSPFSYVHATNTSPIAVQTYMAYLKDTTRMISNPGLREEVRDDVAVLAHIMDYLRNQHLDGPKAKYVVRRYVASLSGVLQVFPGVVIAPGMEPTRRMWFLRAVENRNTLILTPPYLDTGGAGYIVTLSYATENLVVAMDVTFGYVYKMLLEKMPFCTEQNIKCFLIDDRGYLIYHPKLIDPNGHGPIEQQHIIHKESLVANDILNHNYLVRKILCNDYSDGTIQRYYRLNTSVTEVLANAVQGEHCVKYQLSAVKDTNIFIGVVHATCKVGTTFCPCSMLNRLCLNCNRMEQNECECPCECPLNLDMCIHPNRSLTENDLCTTMPEPNYLIHHSNEYFSVADNDLKPCLPIICETLTTYESCLGVLGCEWCNRDVDGETFLENPFCTSILSCFNGVLGSPTPYGEAVSSIINSNDLLGTSYSPVGPVIGSVIGVGVVLVLLFFCYRSYTSSNVDRFYLTTQENQVGMSDLNVSDDYHEIDNHQDKLLQDAKKSKPVVSPYCVSTGYRRPQTAADSDHGYSTMTPHDESEHLSLAPVEIDSLEDDCISDSTSINTSVSSKQPIKFDPRSKLKLLSQQDLQVTTLPHKNCVIAPVTVHRNMEHAQ